MGQGSGVVYFFPTVIDPPPPPPFRRGPSEPPGAIAAGAPQAGLDAGTGHRGKQSWGETQDQSGGKK